MVPEGGGPPSAADAAPVPALVVGFGGLLMAFGALAVFVPVARSALGTIELQPASAPQPTPVAELPVAITRPLPATSRRLGAPEPPYVLAALAGLAAAALLALIAGSRGWRR